MATILETINTVTDKIVSLVGTRANKDLSNLTALGEAKLVSGTSGLPVGTVIAYMGTDVPTGYLLMDGRTLSRTTYAALFKVIGTTQGAGDGSTTFGIADMTDGRYLMGSTVAGGRLAQNLPNPNFPTHTGSFRGSKNVSDACTGSFVYNANIGAAKSGFNSSNTFTMGITLNATHVPSNSIYTTTNKVRTDSLNVKFFIKYQ